MRWPIQNEECGTKPSGVNQRKTNDAAQWRELIILPPFILTVRRCRLVLIWSPQYQFLIIFFLKFGTAHLLLVVGGGRPQRSATASRRHRRFAEPVKSPGKRKFVVAEYFLVHRFSQHENFPVARCKVPSVNGPISAAATAYRRLEPTNCFLHLPAATGQSGSFGIAPTAGAQRLSSTSRTKLLVMAAGVFDIRCQQDELNSSCQSGSGLSTTAEGSSSAAESSISSIDGQGLCWWLPGDV